MPKRAVYDKTAIDAILDEGLVAHLAFALDGQPYAIPTLHARVGELVYIHGSSASRALRALASGVPACLTVTLLDGLVLARAALHHSVNYRSAMLLGQAVAVEDELERLRALKLFTERIVPGRWPEVRAPSRKELKAVKVLAMDMGECSAKARTGPPLDEPQDVELDVWAGVVPLRMVAGEPQDDPLLRPGQPRSASVRRWVSAWAGEQVRD